MEGEKLEKFIEKWHFRLELVRTLVPIIILMLQVVLFYKLYF